ncbi:probable nucleoredoxin 1 [Athalia rosae]|uniref:probable nucleoredoxin 1 n=1 Tax=Athalia rosae TaxID=37344 RepID=UPI002033FFA3|nr:probable nucleoredoxin 1 [Athalia rosae]
MDTLRGQVVINNKNEAFLANDIINDVQFVAYYFSASWCPPCETFLPLVKELNEEIARRELLMQMFYVPSDHDQDEMYDFFSKNHGNW